MAAARRTRNSMQVVTIDPLLQYLDFAGTVIFGITGCLVAARKKNDLVGFMLLSMVAGTGGGTLRDMILGRLPVFWVSNPMYIYLCVGTAVVMFLVARRIEMWRPLLLWLDALGLAVFSVLGCGIALQAGAPPAVCWLMGVMTAAFGGIIRDVLAGEPSLVMRREIYATAAFLGAGIYWSTGSAWAGVIAAFLLRGTAIYFRLSLPGYSSEDIGGVKTFSRRKFD